MTILWLGMSAFTSMTEDRFLLHKTVDHLL